jgi:adenylate cyclase
MNAGWPPERRLEIGIGINTGKMTVGNMGSSGRMNYTAMGDEVNLGARLEGVNKGYYLPDSASHYSKIIISEYTYQLVKDKVLARDLDNIRVKGKNKPVAIYELIDVPEGLEPPVKVDSKSKVPVKA